MCRSDSQQTIMFLCKRKSTAWSLVKCALHVLIECWCRKMTPTQVSHNRSLNGFGILLFLNCRMIFISPKTFHLPFISSVRSLLGLGLWNIVGSQIIVWCWAAAVLLQDPRFSPCYREEPALPDHSLRSHSTLWSTGVISPHHNVIPVLFSSTKLAERDDPCFLFGIVVGSGQIVF